MVGMCQCWKFNKRKSRLITLTLSPKFYHHIYYTNFSILLTEPNWYCMLPFWRKYQLKLKYLHNSQILWVYRSICQVLQSCCAFCPSLCVFGILSAPVGESQTPGLEQGKGSHWAPSLPDTGMREAFRVKLNLHILHSLQLTEHSTFFFF